MTPPIPDQKFLAGWADMDWNSHMANTAYLNKVVNQILNAAGALCPRVTSTRTFMNLDTRRLVAPPPAVLAAYPSRPRTEDYADLPSSIKARG